MIAPGSDLASPAAFDLDAPWRISDGVTLRAERFGALAYNFDTRQLIFLKSKLLLALVCSLADQPSAREACRAHRIAGAELTRYERALATLARDGMLSRQSPV